jgi:competence protein ComEC
MEMKGNGPGWGQAIVIQTPNGKTYLYDTGSNYPEGNFDAGEDMIAPFLEKNNITEIDGVVISHSHRDHFGGFEYLMNNYKIKELYDGGYKFTSDLKYDSLYKPEYIANGGKYWQIKQGDFLLFDKDLEIEILSPPEGYIKEESLSFDDPIDHHNPNLNSIVMRVKYKNDIFLFVGDLNENGQNYLVEQYSVKDLKTTVLCLGHGGSFSTFAEKIKPEIVVGSCLNGVDQPAKEGKKVFNKIGADFYATCWNGTVELISDGNGVKVSTERTYSQE